MKVLVLICRILLGAIFLFFGFNILHPFLPMGSMPPANSLPAHFFTAMMGSGWMKVIGVLQMLGGLLVLIGGTLPFGLCLLCPITFNILCFHLLLMGGHGIAPGLFATVLEIVLLWGYRANFAAIWTARARPAV